MTALNEVLPEDLPRLGAAVARQESRGYLLQVSDWRVEVVDDDIADPLVGQ